MAIGGVPFKLTAEDMGGVDFANAFGRGLDNYIKSRQAEYAQPMLAEQLAQAQITTDFMPRAKDADIAYKEAATGLVNKDIDNYQQRFLDRIGGGAGAPASPDKILGYIPELGVFKPTEKYAVLLSANRYGIPIQDYAQAVYKLSSAKGVSAAQAIQMLESVFNKAGE